MKLLKKWLFPALTCLIVLGAAVLPARVSQARDARQFAQVHTEEMEGAALLPSPEALSFTERLALYSRLYSAEHPVLSYEGGFDASMLSDPLMVEDIQCFLTSYDLVPSWYFEEEPFRYIKVSRLIVQDAEDIETAHKPVIFWKYSWSLYENQHTKTLSLVIDDETCLPIHLVIYDTNIAQWIPYKTGTLEDRAYTYFEALGLAYGIDVWPDDYLDTSGTRLLLLSLRDTDLRYRIEQTPTSLSIEPELLDGGTTYDG